MDLAFLLGYLLLAGLAYYWARSTAWWVICIVASISIAGGIENLAISFDIYWTRTSLQLLLLVALAVPAGLAWLRARVRDPGSGFKPRKANPGGSDFANLNGRGLRLMEKYSDALYFNEQGNEVSFLKFLPKDSPCS